MSLIRKVVYLNSERHADILGYLSSQESESAAIRQALQEKMSTPLVPQLDREALRQVLREELACLSLRAPAGKEDDEMEEVLDDLASTLLLE